MNNNRVVQIDTLMRAREQSEQARRRYFLERETHELKALRMARVRRIARDKRVWFTATAIACACAAALSAWLTARWSEPKSAAPTAVSALGSDAGQHQALTIAALAVAQQPQPAPPLPVAAPPLVSPVQAPVAARAVVPVQVSPAPDPIQAPAQAVMPMPLPTVNLPPGIALPNAQPAALTRKAPQAAKTVPAPATKPAVPNQPGGFVAYKAPPVAEPPVATAPVPAPAPQAAVISATPAQPLAATPVPVPAPPAPAPTPAPVAFSIVGIPTDKVVLVKLPGDETIRPVTVGQRLPNGEILQSVNPATGQASTGSRVLGIGKN